MILKRLRTGKERFAAVLDNSFNANGTVLLLKSATIAGSTSPCILQWVNLSGGKVDTIWMETASQNGTIIGNCVFDDPGTQHPFIVQEKEGIVTTNTFWYYRAGMEKAALMANNQSDEITLALKSVAPLHTSVSAEGISFSPSYLQVEDRRNSGKVERIRNKV